MKQSVKAVILMTLVLMCSSAAHAAWFWESSPKENSQDSFTGMEFIYVKGGCYERTDVSEPSAEAARPASKVCVSDFSIGKFEVTQGQWEKLMGNNPSEFKACGEKCPVDNVSWNDAQEFIARFNKKSGKKYRLPTEAEWEYAARSGGKPEEYPGGLTADDSAWHQGNSADTTHPVGTRKPNGLGLYDMSGNIAEWCSDWHEEGYYAKSKTQDPKGPATGTRRVLRGGRWSSVIGDPALRTSDRSYDFPENRENNYGLRLVLE